MRDADRIDRVTTKLFRLWRKPPHEDQRLGQLLLNLSRRAGGELATADTLWEIEDYQWEEWLDIALDRAT